MHAVGAARVMVLGDEREQYLHERLLESQLRYTYFLLAGAAAAIAYALKQTESSPIRLRQIPVAIAVASWGLSFFFGCRYVGLVQATIRTNVALIQIQKGTFTEIPVARGLEGYAEELARKTAQTNADSANARSQWQFRFLIAGAVAYIVWHTLEMIARTHL